MADSTPTCTIFYSWQHELPARTTRSFIERALEEAAHAIRTDATVEARPDIDQATANVPGSPDIFDTIRAKIDVAEAVVCDVSIVQGRDAGDVRPTPNANVLVEVGYAMRSLATMDRLVLVMNTAYGGIKSLPFDLHKYRLTTYELGPDATDDERRAVRSDLASKLRSTFKHVLAKPSRRTALDLTRCGSIFWMANNLVYAAYALAENRVIDAVREWNHAIHHAQQLPIPREHLTRLRLLQERRISDEHVRKEVVQEMHALWNDIGRFVQAHQPDFPQRDVQDDTGG